MLSSQEEQAERRRVLEDERRLRDTYHARAQTDLETPGRFGALGKPNVVGVAQLRQRILDRCEWQDGPLETPCLIWTGALSGGPGNYYGHVTYGGMSLKTHRAIWMAENGEIENDMEVCHDCDKARLRFNSCKRFIEIGNSR
jgi:hypothetical protein